MKTIWIDIKKTHEDAIIPEYQTEGAAGFDFHCIEDIEIKPKETKLASTGLAMAIPQGFELQIRPRSGLSLKTKLRIANSPATIDSDYRGSIGIILDNTGDEIITFKKGDRIAQGVLNEIPQAIFKLVDELDGTARGGGGFGSTK